MTEPAHTPADAPLPAINPPPVVRIQIRAARTAHDSDRHGELLAAATVTVPPDLVPADWYHYYGPVGDSGRRTRLETELRKVITDWLTTLRQGAGE